MKKILFVMLGFLVMVTIKAFAYDDHDFQVWNTDVEEFKISKGSKVTLEEEFRWGDNASDFYYHHYDAGYVQNLSKFLSLGLGYRQIFEKKNGKFKAENDPYALVLFAWDYLGFKFDDRNRLEYRHFDYQADSWRYRNKITMKFPWKWTKQEIQPYVADELFLGLNGVNFNQNRLTVGLGFTLAKNLKGEVYYMLASSKSSGTCVWKDTNVLGTKFKIAF